MKKTFYITTPIYYPSGNLHIGNSYTTILCDSINRYKQEQGYDTRYLTGMDEHGQKVQNVALEQNKKPIELVDEIAEKTKTLWNVLGINYDDFIRTTEDRHERVVEKVFEQLLAQDDIYLGHYEGHYCVPCESFFTETQLAEGKKCPDCNRDTTVIKEESYFLRLSKYSDRLLQFIKDNPDFIRPESRKNEVVSFIEGGINDLSVSRTSFDWGIKVKSNPKHVIYVWIDALTNYITALGYNSDNDELFDKYWNKGDEVLHVVGKDILRFHAIYWPIMLMALGVDVNFKLYAHGWYLMSGGKMSKSKGSVVYPTPLVEQYGLDALRYYLLREINYGNDGDFTPEKFVTRTNSDLANDLGNLLNRTIKMMNQYLDGEVSKPDKMYFVEEDTFLINKMKECVDVFNSNMDQFKVALALDKFWSLIRESNRYVDLTKPWILGKDESKKQELNNVLYNLSESLRIIAITLRPILLESSEKILAQLQASKLSKEDSIYGVEDSYKVTSEPTPIFPRLDKNKEIAYIVDLMTKKEEKEEVIEENLITIEDFFKVELVVGEVLECELHPNADKLLVSKIDTKDKVRQIVSGISNYYTPSEFIGKKVVVVKNLKPVKLRGVLSEGMILAGKNKKTLEVLELQNLKVGDKIS